MAFWTLATTSHTAITSPLPPIIAVSLSHRCAGDDALTVVGAPHSLKQMCQMCPLSLSLSLLDRYHRRKRSREFRGPIVGGVLGILATLD